MTPAPMPNLTMGSEDMADLLNVVPGAFFNLGHHGTVPLHNPVYVFDDTDPAGRRQHPGPACRASRRSVGLNRLRQKDACRPVEPRVGRISC